EPKVANASARPMSETKTGESAPLDAHASRRGALPLAPARLVMTGLGVALVALNLVLSMTGATHTSGAAISAVLWGAAAACFLGALVVFMVEPNSRRDEKDAKGEARASGAGKSPGSTTEKSATVKEPSKGKAAAHDKKADAGEADEADAKEKEK